MLWGVQQGAAPTLMEGRTPFLGCSMGGGCSGGALREPLSPTNGPIKGGGALLQPHAPVRVEDPLTFIFVQV